MENKLISTNQAEALTNKNILMQGTITSENIVPFVAILTMGVAWIVHDLIVHGYSVDADVDTENHKVKVKMKSSCEA